MKKRILSIVVLAVLSGCSKDMEHLQVNDCIRIAGTIVGPDAETRTSMSGSTASFASGDKIGISDSLFARNNVLFTLSGGTWSTTTPMYWYNGTASHTFYAYYPYSTSNQGPVVSIPVLNNQPSFSSTPDTASDMLVAGPKRQARSAGTSVAFTFSHAFSLLEFNITAPLISTFSLQTMTIQAGNTAGGTNAYGIVNITNDINRIGYNPATRSITFTPANNTASTFAQSITKPIPSTGVIGIIPITIYAIVLPGQYANPTPGIQIQVQSLSSGSKPTSLVKLTDTQFLPGRKYVYNVRIGGLIGLRTSPDANEEPESEISLIIN